MKTFYTILLLLISCLYFSEVNAQSPGEGQNAFQGEMKLIIDVSAMKDTAGRFMVMTNGQRFYPKIKNHQLVVKETMTEPRKVFFAFYPAPTIRENPGKPLNEIAAEVSNNIDFLGVPGTYHIKVDGTVANSQILNASVAQKEYATLQNLKDGFNKIMEEEQAGTIGQIKPTSDQKIRDSLIAIYYKRYQEKYPQYYKDQVLNFIRQHPDAPASLMELELYSHQDDKDLDMLNQLYNHLSERIRSLPTAKRVYQKIDHELFARKNLTGQPALGFTLPNQSGQPVSLADFRGKVTLLEFWASWCGVCRTANPGLLRAYKKYSDKGFDILGVSVDTNREHWLKAVADDDLLWTQVLDKKGAESVAKRYHVYSYPSNFLIDTSGKIVGVDLNVKELNNQLEKLYGDER